MVRAGNLLCSASMLLLALTLGMGPAEASAQGLGAAVNGRDAGAQPAGTDLSDVGIDQKLNAQLPLDLAFRDESGRAVTLGQYFHGKPVVLSFVYYSCSLLCPEVLRGMATSFHKLTFDPGKQYDVVTVSFDPKDTPALSAEKKAMVLKQLDHPGAGNGWHFLTGDPQSIRALTQAAGFRYKWDPQSKQFAHGTAIMVVTPQGRISKYFYGIEFKPADLRFGLIQASNDRIGTVADEILLFCCKYNATTGKYDWLVARIMFLSGIIIMLVLGTFLGVMMKLGPKHRPA